MMRRSLLVAGGVLAAAIYWLRTHPSALPYRLRLFVTGPHPFIGPEKLLTVLTPEPGERVLEVGPGTGHYSLPVAERLGPTGTLELVDIVPDWLEHTREAATSRGLTNISATAADATQLPHADESFDAAFLVQVLGEIPDQLAALKELRRVLKPDGRLVIGESALDPHVVSRAVLAGRSEAAGLSLERIDGNAIGYFARFGVSAAGATSGRAEQATSTERGNGR